MKFRTLRILSLLLALAVLLTACASTPASSNSSEGSSSKETSSQKEETNEPSETSSENSESENTAETSEPASSGDTSESEASGEESQESSDAEASQGEVPTEAVAAPEEALFTDLPVGDVAEYTELEEGEGADDEEIQRIDRVMRDYSPVDSILINNAKTFYYYEQLDATLQGIYDAILMAAQDPSGSNYVVYIASEDPTSSSFKKQINRAFWAVVYDHPELYWLYASRTVRYKYSTSSANKNMVYFYVDEYKTFTEDVKAFNAAVKSFLSDINTNQSEAAIARQIHDKLISMVTYDYDLSDGNTRNYNDLGHTAYGALVDNGYGNKNYAVCDGYTAAFTYLCQQVGIEAIYIGGSAGKDTSSMGGHAWNMAKLDGTWYEIDATWDDFGNKLVNPSISSEWRPYYEEMYYNSYYYDLYSHYLFMVSTAEISDYYRNSYYDYYSADGRWIFYPCGDSVHRKDNEYDCTFDPWVYLMNLAPVAY